MKANKKGLFFLSAILLILVIVFMVGCFSNQEFQKTDEYWVGRVIDGDTIEVETLGKVRYIGIDTPELGEPYGKEALEKNKELVEGKKVKLEFDIQQNDKYGRVLAYVYVGTTFINSYLVENGYAQVMTIPPDVKYVDLFVKLQEEAREAKRGLWGEVNEITQEYWASSNSDKFHRPTLRSVYEIERAKSPKHH